MSSKPSMMDRLSDEEFSTRTPCSLIEQLTAVSDAPRMLLSRASTLKSVSSGRSHQSENSSKSVNSRVTR